MTTPDPLARLDFETKLPIDPMLVGRRILELIAGSNDEVLARIEPHFRPCNTTVRWLDGHDVLEVRIGPERLGFIHANALIPHEGTGYDGPQ